MKFSTEFWRKNGTTRGGKFDVIVTFHSTKIHIEDTEGKQL